MARVGIIGLGLVGSALAQRLMAAGFEVAGYDLDATKRSALAESGGVPCTSWRDVASRCDRILLSLPLTTVRLMDEFAEQLSGKLIVDTSTSPPEETQAIGRRIAAAEGEYVDATIAGSSAQVRRGEVVVMAGGAHSAVERAKELLESFAKQTFHLGPVGSGARMKLVVNLVLGLNRAVLAEGLAFAKACGIDPAQALEVLQAGPAFSRVMETKGPRMVNGRFTPEARLSQHTKDVLLILEAANQAGAQVPLSEVHASLLQKLIEAGCGDLDNSAIFWAFAPDGLHGRSGAS